MTTKLFERLVTKFSIKVADLIKYLEISKATIYNYRNLEKFSDIPKDKQYKIFYLFGKETEEELVLVLDESDPDILAQYLNRISSILKESVQGQKQSLSSIEELTSTVERLGKENAALQRQLSVVQALNGIDEFTRTVLLEKVASIANGATTAEIKEFIDYLEIFEKYKKFTRGK
jgi:transcriptional regulator of heat shock response